MWESAEKERRTTTAQNHIVARGHLQQDCLHGRRVVAIVRPEALQETGPFFRDTDKI
jgi:hypothetical protein